MVKNSPANAEDVGSTPAPGRFPGDRNGALLMVPVDSDSDSVIESRLPPFSQHPLSSARHTTFLSDMGEHWAGAHLSEGERHPELNTRRLASCSTSWGSMCRRPLLACPLGCHSCPYSSTVLTPLSTAPPSTSQWKSPVPPCRARRSLM